MRRIGVVLLGDYEDLCAPETEVERTGRVTDVVVERACWGA